MAVLRMPATAGFRLLPGTSGVDSALCLALCCFLQGLRRLRRRQVAEAGLMDESTAEIEVETSLDASDDVHQQTIAATQKQARVGISEKREVINDDQL
jgi:hypothetical protein